MCTVLLPPDVYPITGNKYINQSITCERMVSICNWSGWGKFRSRQLVSETKYELGTSSMLPSQPRCLLWENYWSPTASIGLQHEVSVTARLLASELAVRAAEAIFPKCLFGHYRLNNHKGHRHILNHWMAWRFYNRNISPTWKSFPTGPQCFEVHYCPSTGWLFASNPVSTFCHHNLAIYKTTTYSKKADIVNGDQAILKCFDITAANTVYSRGAQILQKNYGGTWKF
jgi:hypothetical protein